jgi:hypothetical protein
MLLIYVLFELDFGGKIIMSGQVDLENKLVPIEYIAELAIDDSILLQELLEGIVPQTQKSARRENCSQTLMFMAETWPEILLPHWDYFAQLVKSNNGSSKYVAIYVLASLTKTAPDKFSPFFTDYFNLLDDESVMVASHAARNSAKIAQACPALQTEIINQLLKIDQTHHDPNRLSLVKAYIIEVLDILFPYTSNQLEIIEFIKAQTNCPSPKTVKSAKAFLKKYT